MLDCEFFKTERQAIDRIETMMGWGDEVCAVAITRWDEPDAWAIEVPRSSGAPMYLRDDGYVR